MRSLMLLIEVEVIDVFFIDLLAAKRSVNAEVDLQGKQFFLFYAFTVLFGELEVVVMEYNSTKA